jgi:dipeptidyl aminopeptidase/acylaminoacyl peptidase
MYPIWEMTAVFFRHLCRALPWKTGSWCVGWVVLALLEAGTACAADLPENRLRLIDLFDLEFASDPQISPDGRRIVFARNFSDIMKDQKRSVLWSIASDGTDLRPLTPPNENIISPRWSNDGKQLLYASRRDAGVQIYVQWMDSGQIAKVTSVRSTPKDMAWSPDRKWIAFVMLVPTETKPFAELPSKPEGAEWGKPAKVIQKLLYREDGEGYLEDGFHHIFVVPVEGGTPQQITHGSFNHAGPLSWSPDSKAILFSANRHPDWEFDPLNTEVYEVTLESGAIKALTNRKGPDQSPAVSPDGKLIVCVGFDDRLQGYQVSHLYVMNRDGSQPRVLLPDLDRDVEGPRWSKDGQGIYFQYDDHGNTRIAFAPLDGRIEVLAKDVGGVAQARPYPGGSFSVADNGKFAFTQSRPDYPADIAVGALGSTEVRRLTHLNDDLFVHKELGVVEEIQFESSYDKRKIQGWVIYPAGFDTSKTYPLILEIHGGPFANYGDRFSAELQVYAAAGYLVLYVNPRGSTSYGEEFGNLIHHAYPGQDYDDLMSGVDAVIRQGHVDTNNLFVTGGSGGGVLTSWIVGKTQRFRAAVVAKPVINWYSFVLTSDDYNMYYRYWFPGFPWEHAQHYLERSPISFVGNVQTPTMLLTGEDDHRTPISESEQFYQALKLRKIDTALVRLPEASHSMEARPTQLISKVAHILKWFEKYRYDKREAGKSPKSSGNP